MFRNVIKTGVSLNLLIPSEVIYPDNLKSATETERKAKISGLQYETGWERVKGMFETDEFGNASKEIITITNVAAMSLFTGAVYGGFINSRVAYMNFIKNNQATAFNDHLDAKKHLQDAVTKSFARGAWKWGWRLTLFCSSFVGISTTISVYRGKSGIMEYVAAGLISGSLYKFNAGPRGWVVGGGLGAALGLLSGCTTWGLLKLTGMTMEDVRYWQYHWRQERESYINKSVTEYMAKEEDGIRYEHDLKVGEAGKSLDNLEK